MLERRIPEWVRHAPTPGAAGFGVLAALDAGARGILVSVFPLAIYDAFGDAGTTSLFYGVVGAVSLGAVLFIPWLARIASRRWTFTSGAALYVIAGLIGASGGPSAAPVALAMLTLAAVTVFLCINAYVLDFIAQAELGRVETLRMFYAALAWCVGPALGVFLYGAAPAAPFAISAMFGAALIALFWFLRLGNGKVIRKARAPQPNPIVYLGRFFAQPRLVAGWSFAVLRSCGWWIYAVYLPIFALEAGLGDKVGGFALSLSNCLLFTTPLLQRWVKARSVRIAVRTGFLGAGVLFLMAALLAQPTPWLAIAALFSGSAFLVLLDISAGLPFLMAVKPSERTEMSAVYSSYRDISGVATPLAAGLVLLAAPLPAIFAAGSAGFFAAFALANQIHPRLGASFKPKHPANARDDRATLKQDVRALAEQ